MPDNQIDMVELEKQTNAEFGVPTETPEPNEPEVESSESQEPVETESETSTPTPQGQVESASQTEEKPDFSEYLKETPFKEIPELAKGYKELQSQFTKERERVKPYEDLLSRVNQDFGLRTYLSQAIQAYDHPEMLSAYQQQSEPKAENYDMFSPEGQQKFMQDMKAFYEKTIDTRINTRLMGMEQNAKIEEAKREFRSKFPNENPDEVLQFAKEKGTNWSLEDVWKIKNFDRIKSEALAEARKEVTKQLETASKSGTPSVASAPKAAIKLEDVMTHIAKYGSESAKKKFGDKRFNEVVMESAGMV